MKRFYLGFLLLLFLCISAQAQIFICKNANISFFSSTAVKDIEAKSTTAVSAINTETKKVFFKVVVRTFTFPSGLMQEHFNTDYMESSKYPYAQFSGKIINDIDFNQQGKQKVTVKGKLTIHGITNDCTVTGTIEMKQNKMNAHAVFNVVLADYKVEAPSALTKELAKQVKITVDADYMPYVPKQK